MKMKRSKNWLPMNSPSGVKIGERAVGKRVGSPGHGKHGLLVEAYYTVNEREDGPFKNSAYLLLCDDGKERVYQNIDKEE
jgi:hypothetical protein